MDEMTAAEEADAGEVRPDEEAVLCECGSPKEDGHLCGMVAVDNREVDFDELRGLS